MLSQMDLDFLTLLSISSAVFFSFVASVLNPHSIERPFLYA